MEHLFDAWPLISQRIESAGHLLLLADYDGTLVPIAERPENTVLPDRVKKLLQALANNKGNTLGIISGRPLDQIKAEVGIDGIFYAGNHGLEADGPGMRFVHPDAESVRPLIQDIAEELSQKLSQIDGVIIEDKGLSLGLHYRLVKDAEVDTVLDIFHRVAVPLCIDGRAKISFGKKVCEVRPPVDWDKGSIVSYILEKSRASLGGDILPVYLGDDSTDEDSFMAVAGAAGVSIFVGSDNPLSIADYFLNSPLEVERLLTMVLGLRPAV